ncbi:unnamed protein product [Mycena citricolor]|uniref:Uncharacterized protein n=1 Tax=Mycena citricolor TaxID=2018698 RepID=A0AAD2H4S6_9AGAR|nr:unnamed protein product [Mycena citricolor]
MSNNRSPTETTTASKPIPISSSALPRARPRSFSVSSTDSSASGGSPTEIATPLSTSLANPKIVAQSPATSTSPILSYFLAQSPTKAPGTFPFRKFGPPPVFEEDETDIKELAATKHARRASTAITERFSQNTSTVVPDAQQERGQGLLRRLSLTMNRSPPIAPPNSAVSPTQASQPFGRHGRSATLSSPERPRRAPSPMGERILKGHFDGFN